MKYEVKINETVLSLVNKYAKKNQTQRRFVYSIKLAHHLDRSLVF